MFWSFKFSKTAFVDKECQVGQKTIFKDYFTEDLVYSDEIFRGCYQIQCFVFLRIMHEVCSYDFLFCLKMNAASVSELLSI
jgi:hypothetical protein